ncbi:hypothetical protein HOE04_02020 [archaeon]|jgi:hypothetical protein|nr:hypothetical protein [archaeon]
MKIKTQRSEKKMDDVNLVQLPSNQFVIPNSQEIDLSKVCNQKIITMPFAVKGFKFSSRNMNKFNSSNVSEQRQGYKELCNLYPNSKFLLHIQVKEKTEFTDEQIEFIEKVQEIEQSPFFCVYEKSYKQSEKELKSQLIEARKKYPDKEIVPAVEIYTRYNAEKVNVMSELNIKKCIVIYRNYIKYEEEWKELMGLLDTMEISRFVFGVNPRMRRKNRASVLLAPLRYGANYVCHGLPWSGGKGNVYLLDNWVYKVTQRATYPISRVDALNKVNTLTPEIKTLSVEQIETLLY